MADTTLGYRGVLADSDGNPIPFEAVDIGGGKFALSIVVNGTAAVSGPLTDAQLRATAVPISDGGGSLTVDGAVTATLPAAVIGPGSPIVDSYFCAKIDLAASTANQEVVAAPGAGKQLWIYGIGVLLDTAAGTVKFHDSAPTDITGTMALSDEGGLVVAPSGNFAMPIWKCGTNTALQADTGAGTVDGWINGAIVSV